MRHVFSPVQSKPQTRDNQHKHTREKMSAPAPASAPASRLGLDKDVSTSKGRGKRKSLPKREGPIWKTVTVLVEHDTCPSVQCNNCPKKFSGGSFRIAEHITGMGSIAACTCETDAFLELKQKLIEEKTEKKDTKLQRTAEADTGWCKPCRAPALYEPGGELRSLPNP